MKNIYDERYDIRMANVNDIDNIMRFLDLHWKHNHILSVDKKLFEYEFVDNDQVNMTIAVDRNTSEIEAIAGFICCSKGRPDKKDVWGSFWKVNEEHKNVTFLGIELMRRQLGLINCREHLGIGVNPITNAPIRRTAKVNPFVKTLF